METRDFLRLLGRKKQTVFSILLMFVLLTALLTIIQPFKYEAKSRVLLLQHNGASIDPYNAAKSSQFISSLLAQVVPSNVFLNDVLEAGFNVDKAYFGDNSVDRLKTWQKTVEANAINDTGIIEIKTYHTDKTQAEQINNAVINIIKTKNNQYYGRNEDISIKIIDEPISSNLPVRPNVVVSFSISILVSLLISFSFIYLFPGEEYDLNIIPKRKKKLKVVNIQERPVYVEEVIPEREIQYKEPMKKYVPRQTEAPKNFEDRGDMKNIFNQSQDK